MVVNGTCNQDSPQGMSCGAHDRSTVLAGAPTDGAALTEQPCHISTDAGMDVVNHPPHYTAHPSGVECIAITRHMGFNLGNATKYIWRAGLKGEAVEDLRKAAFYIADEIARIEAIQRAADDDRP